MEWGGLLGGIASGLFGYKGTEAQNIASAQQAQKAMAFSKEAQLRQMKFQERMSGSAHQRQMADMRKAGLNPILSAKYGGASSPAGSSAAGVAAPQFNKAQVALQNATTAANIQNIEANTNIAKWKGIIAQGQSIPWQIAIDLQKIPWPKIPEIPEFDLSNFSSAREASRQYKPMDKKHLKPRFREMPLPGSHHPVSKSRKIQALRNYSANYQTTIRRKRSNK